MPTNSPERTAPPEPADPAPPAPRPAVPGSEVGPDPALESLRAYVHAKLALADQLRIVGAALAALGRDHGERQCGDLMAKLAEDRFTLAVLGQFAGFGAGPR